MHSIWYRSNHVPCSCIHMEGKSNRAFGPLEMLQGMGLHMTLPELSSCFSSYTRRPSAIHFAPAQIDRPGRFIFAPPTASCLE